ncbi:hypothetical protein SLS56_012110, partial [Neofusicoccum ribis]
YGDSTYPSKLHTDHVNAGFVSVEEASMLLSHRQASREGDDVVIWSLLVDENAYHSAEKFWLSRCDITRAPADNINTGFLISSAPRIKKVPGLGWAPATPTCNFTSDNYFLSGDGHRTRLARFNAKGLTGSFAVNIFRLEKGPDSEVYQRAINSFLKKQEPLKKLSFRWIALLQPLLDLETEHPTAYRYRGNGNAVEHIVFGVCVSNSRTTHTAKWTWKGVYQWDYRHSLPEFWEAELTLV